jgi:AraC family transcriptional regulator, exoenzyme S synthesis regulatory protein ExsA
MNNLYDYNLNAAYRKIECDGLLFVEYQCIPGDIRTSIWSQHSYLAFIQSGKKTWISPDGEFPVVKGDAIFCKKGAHIIENYYEEQFCAVIFFIPDDFVRQVVIESGITRQTPGSHPAILKLNVDLHLGIYFESVTACLLHQQDPSRLLLKLKFRELILQVITTGSNPELASHFLSLAKEDKSNLKQIMMENYLYPLSQEEFARLTGRSVSSFKRDFQQVFNTSLTKWLMDMRLAYAKTLLLTTDENINEISFRSGFETTSHFIRCFKKHHNLPPLQFRQKHTATVV